MKRAGAVVCALFVLGCYPGQKAYDPHAGKRSVFLASVRQTAPEPVYNRLRWVHPPESLPDRDVRGAEAEAFQSAPPIRPVYHMTLKNASLLDASRVLAATARYEAFCAPSISEQKISIDNLGTIDELGSRISSLADINVVVDHDGRTVRFLAPEVTEPRLFNEQQ